MERTMITAVILLLPFVILGIFYKIYKNRPFGFEGSSVVEGEAENLDQTKYDLFLSVPMAAFESDTGYEKFRQFILELINDLKLYCAFN
jgi:hypothetical protein